MMGALSQTPAQTGLASILAALGTAAPANGTPEDGGFEQLFASLPKTPGATPGAANPFTVQLTAPGTADVPPTPGVAALPAPAATPAPPAAALFGLPQPGIAIAVEAATPETAAIKTPAPSAKPDAAPAPGDAASAASLLIAVATPLKAATPVTHKPALVADADAETGTDGEPAAAPVQPAAPLVAEIVAAPVAATIVATAMPAADKPVTEKAAKPAAPTTSRQATASAAMPQPLAAAKPEAAQPQQTVVFAAIEPKPAKPAVDVAASMTILFAQPDLQGAAPLAEAVRAVPVAERTLDLTSDDQWIAQLAADIAATKSDKGDISFRLMPRHLGRLDVSMLSGDQGVTVRLDTQHEATATIVSAAQPRLVEDLRQQGVRVADAQVTHTPAEAGRQQQNPGQGRSGAPDTSHLIETAAEQADSTLDERTADRRGRFA
ncbi:flagellar hook-length control protein FliK [Sphingopyxis sp. H050]|uniref:flagellar hook-length control protein FliK n=1 Tax=Sphingopyxis sp. H050 TaxID=1759072 RepID=UPI0009E86EBF|nr:flagellar hook-length control protein FliK [Sphingopyxis sp. H050]